MYSVIHSILTFRKLSQIALILIVISIGHLIAYKVVNIPAQLEMVILFSILVFYPILKNPQVGIILLFLIMPFIPFLRRLYYLQYSRPAADPLIVLGDIIITFIITGFFFEFREKKNYKESGTKFVQIIIFYFIYLIFRTFVFNILPTSEAILKFRLYGPSVLMFIIGTAVAYNRQLILHILYLTVFIGIIGALYGLYQLTFGYSESEKIWFSSISFTTLFIKGLARPFSFFQSPAAFADYMQLSIIGVIVLISTLKKLTSKFFLLLLLPLFFYGALITSVRSNWVGIIVSIIFWIILMQLKNNKTRVIVLVLIVIVFIFSQITDFNPVSGISSFLTLSSNNLNDESLDLLITQRADAILNPFNEYSFISRMLMWKLIFNLSLEPFMGFVGRGIGSFNADSVYFSYLAELGYPGLIFILSITILFIIRGLALIGKSDGFVQGLAKGITILNISLAIINITGTHIHSFPGDVYFWFFNGVLLKLEAIIRKGDLPISYENITYN